MYDRSRVALITQLGEHSTSIAEVVGLNPAHRLNFFQVSVLIFFQISLLVVLRPHLTVITQLLLMDKIHFIHLRIYCFQSVEKR